MFKKTKIVATIGPQTTDKEKIEKMILAGVNVFRLNFSHGSYKEHQLRINLIKKASLKLKKPVAILQDLCGPKIRIGNFINSKVFLKHNQKFILTTKKVVGDENRVFINYPNITKETKKGEIILLDDGKIELKIDKVKKNEIICHVIYGGELSNQKGVNFPQSHLKISSLTPKDIEDIKFGIKNNFDFIALSFVRTADDVLLLENILKKLKADIKIISKIETREAVKNIDDIIKVSYGIMVARGDLAVEIGAEQVPIIQKNIIKKCNNIGKPVIVATQMLDSMINNPVPTRAEVNDVSNAILDGADAVMLSAETAMGNFPIKTVEVMSRIIKHTEENFDYKKFLTNHHIVSDLITDSISYGAANVAHILSTKLIVALTETGETAKMISRFRVRQPILGLTPNKKTYNRLSLIFGCYPLIISKFKNIEQVKEVVKKNILKNNLAKKGDKIVIVAGIPFGVKGSTNLLMVEAL
ncbi:MAG: pyruvate kinase [Patescibacteria group bacterium]|nr:pyruvate kinase [Patescibacteria group bacterium]MCX7589588.1 pyruvate kinase [Patescibacteria group bacterium]MDW8279854.1 pyruvate kinase [bacterium]